MKLAITGKGGIGGAILTATLVQDGAYHSRDALTFDANPNLNQIPVSIA